MSRIFEALQRSEIGADRICLSRAAGSVAMLRGGGKEAAQSGSSMPAAETPAPVSELADFPSVQVAPTPASRLVSLTDKEGPGGGEVPFSGGPPAAVATGAPLKKLLITSTLPEEGKSLVIGQSGGYSGPPQAAESASIEGDLRRPVQATAVWPGAAARAERVAAGSGPDPEQYLLSGGARLLADARGQPPENPLELMQSGKLAGLMDQLASFFDWIVIDSPPFCLWPIPASGPLGGRDSDGGARRPHRAQQLERGLAAIDQSRLLGVVVNSYNDTHDRIIIRVIVILVRGKSSSPPRLQASSSFQSALPPKTAAVVSAPNCNQDTAKFFARAAHRCGNARRKECKEKESECESLRF